MSNDLQQRKLFHHVEPQSIQSTYTQFTQTDFLISVGAGRSLVRNSWEILRSYLLDLAMAEHEQRAVFFLIAIVARTYSLIV